MKNFLLGASVFALLSFTAVKTELLTVKPATPKSVITYYGSAQEVKITSDKYVKHGYKIHSIVGTHYSDNIFIILEKY